MNDYTMYSLKCNDSTSAVCGTKREEREERIIFLANDRAPNIFIVARLLLYCFRFFHSATALFSVVSAAGIGAFVSDVAVSADAPSSGGGRFATKGSTDSIRERAKSSAATIASLDKVSALTVESLGLAARNLVDRRKIASMVNAFVGADKTIEKTNQIIASMEEQTILLNESLAGVSEQAGSVLEIKQALLDTLAHVRGQEEGRGAIGFGLVLFPFNLVSHYFIRHYLFL